MVLIGSWRDGIGGVSRCLTMGDPLEGQGGGPMGSQPMEDQGEGVPASTQPPQPTKGQVGGLTRGPPRAVPQGYSRKAAALEFLQRLEEAKATYEEGLARDPGNEQLLQGLRGVETRLAGRGGALRGFWGAGGAGGRSLREVLGSPERFGGALKGLGVSGRGRGVGLGCSEQDWGVPVRDFWGP